MALADDVQAKYATQKLVELTNDGRSATTINTAKLDEACTDVESDFRIYVNAEYDSTSDDHRNVGTEAVIEKLRIYKARGGDTEKKAYEKLVEKMKALAKIGPRDRLNASTDNLLSPTGDTDSGQPARPRFDRSKFRGIRPR